MKCMADHALLTPAVLGMKYSTMHVATVIEK